MNRVVVGAMALVVVAASFVAFGQGAVQPKDLLSSSAAGQLLVGGNAQGQVEIVPGGAGFEAKITPGAASWPGVMVVPAGGKPSWDLSLYGHVECKLTNTGSSPFNLGMRVDNASIPGKSPWNTEMFKLAPGASTVARVYFGYSFYFQPNYPLDASAVVRVQFFLNGQKEPAAFKVEELRACGFAGEKPGQNPDQARTRPKDGVFVAKRDFAFASGRDKPQFAKPERGFWDLSEHMCVDVRVKNLGDKPARPVFRMDSDYGSTDLVPAPQAIAAGAEATVRVEFAPKKPWTAPTDPAQLDATKGGRWDRQPGTGTPFRNHKVTALAVFPDPAVASAQRYSLSATAKNPPAVKPAWLGKRPPVPGKWKLAFREEFDGTALDTSVFGVYWWNWWDKRMHCSKDNVIVKDGKMILRAEKKHGFHNDNPDEGKFPGEPRDRSYETDWQTGWADTFGKFTQRYGYWEFRMKLPTAPCLWAGVWLMPDRGLKRYPKGFPLEDWNDLRGRFDTSDDGMEIDIVETQSIWGPHRFNTACHWDGYGKEHKSLGTSCNYIPTDEEGFITVGMLWLPGSLTFYGNGVEFWKWESPRILSTQAYMQFQNQFGGWETEPLDPSQFPCDLVVDYVRIWQREDLATPEDGRKSNGSGLDNRLRAK